MERKEWIEDETFDDLMIEHHHPGALCCPKNGFGMLPWTKTVTKKSNEAVRRITGKTIQQLNQEMIEAICKNQ